MSRTHYLPLLGLAILASGWAAPVRSQSIPRNLPTDTLRVEAHGPGPEIALSSGERLVVWVENRVRIARPGAAPPPVPEALAGEVTARFENSARFAWPLEPIVWTAPREGRLSFGLNGTAAHRMSGSADVIVARLGVGSDTAQQIFAPPSLTLERTAGGVKAYYADRAGFGLDLAALRFRLITAQGAVFQLASWVPAGERETTLPLPPPGLPVPAGVHTLEATITDRLGNDAPRATLTFDSARQDP
ncbi:MAG: hypothetical protein P8Y29_04330 [Gemmatimonadota bacterium]